MAAATIPTSSSPLLLKNVLVTPVRDSHKGPLMTRGETPFFTK
jgi:hypothetical protein